MATSGQPRIDYTNKDYASLLAGMVALAKERVPEWTDQSPNDLGVMLLELFATMGDALFYHQDRIAAESFLETAVERRSVVQLLRLIGYELRPPLAASAGLALLFAPGATGPVTVPRFAAFSATVPGGPVGFEYIGETSLTFDQGALPFGIVDARGALTVLPAGTPLPASLPNGSAGYRVYQTLPVVQVDRDVRGEIVASSDGSAGQRYPLAGKPIVDDTLVVSVDEGGGPAVWTRVPSLLESLGADTHYAVRRDENGVVWIELGDGTYGKAPARGANNITASYSVGGGAKGNVPPGSITKAITIVGQLSRALDVVAANGGTDAEDTASAVVRGPQQFRAMGRAVTASDYQALAMAFGVAKAFAQATSWNNVQLVVAPVGGGQPDDTLAQDLLTYLEPKRVMTTLVDVVGPVYVNVYVNATVTVKPQFALPLVQQQVVDAVGALLAFDNLDFDQILYLSKLYEVIQEIDGVAGVNITRFTSGPASGPSIPPDGQLAFGVTDPRELPQWLGFDGVTSTLTMARGLR